MTTDVQRFGPGVSTWLKPAGAMTVRVVLRGGDAGAALTEDGVTPGELAEMIATTGPGTTSTAPPDTRSPPT